MNDVHDILEQKRLPLLDPNVRSALLNHVLQHKRGVELASVKSQEIYNYLVLKGANIAFTTMNGLADEKPHASHPFAGAKIELHTPYTATQLHERLSQTWFEANFADSPTLSRRLYLTLGSLIWETEERKEGGNAPLIMVPVLLERKDVYSPYHLVHTGEDPLVNPALAIKLYQLFRLELPAFEAYHPEGVNTFIGELNRLITSRKQWQVQQNRCFVNLFNPVPYLQYKNLDAQRLADAPQDSLLQKVLVDGFESVEIQSGETVSIDYLTSPGQINHVLDADNEQLLVIYDALKGINQLVDGPPGTGKTQTIVNLIGASIAEDKKVLVVSNNAASLNQVHSRLETAGIGHLVWQLYGSHVSRPHVLASLKDAILPRDLIQEDEQTLSESLLRARDQLNVYAKSLHSPIRETGVTPYEAYNEMAELDKQLHGVTLPDFDGKGFVTQSAVEFEVLRERVQELQSVIKRLGIVKRHPFWGSKKTKYRFTDKPIIQKHCRLAGQALNTLRVSASELSQYMATRAPGNSEDVIRLVRAASKAIEAPELNGVHITEERWAVSMEELVSLLGTGSKISKLRAEYESILIPEAWEQDMLSVRQALVAHGTKKTRSLIGDYRRARDTLAGLCQNALPKSNDKQLEIVNAMLESQRLVDKLNTHEELALSLFGDQWKGIESNWAHLDKVTSWLIELHQEIMQDAINPDILYFLDQSPDLSKVKNLAGRVAKDFSAFLEKSRETAQLLEMEDVLGITKNSFARLPFGNLMSQFAHWEKNVDALQDIVALNLLAERMYHEGLSDVVKLAVDWSESGKYLWMRILQARYMALLEEALNARRTLANFNSDVHLNVINLYNELDHDFLQMMAKRILRRHASRLLERRIPSTQIHTLLNELEKAPGRLLVEMLAEIAGDLQQIKPVVQTTPADFAQLIASSGFKFDLVIFDDVEQLTSLEALPVLAHGRQLIAFGDERLGTPLKSESLYKMLLHKGIALRELRTFYKTGPADLLSWINRELYDNSISAFPHADEKSKAHELIVQVAPEMRSDAPVPAMSWAGRVIDAALTHVSLHPAQSVGVVVPQLADVVPLLKELDRRRRNDKSLETHLAGQGKEPFYIESIEQARGKRRDVIFFACPLRKHLKRGVLNTNGSAAEKKPAEESRFVKRCLSLLGTLTRNLCHIYTDLTADEISRAKEDSPEVNMLAEFLQHIKGKDAVTAELAIASKFEMVVGDALRANGYSVAYHVGPANSYIDMAILDETRPGAFLLGIQSDGHSYANARSARERERLLPDRLKKQGWELHRIWSVEWFKNPQRELNRIIDRVEALRELRSGHSSDGFGDVSCLVPTIQKGITPNGLESPDRQIP